MAIYMFRSQRFAELLAFTDTGAGEALPANYGPWELLSDGAAMPGFSDALGMDPILAAIKAEGYFLAGDGPITRAIEH